MTDKGKLFDLVFKSRGGLFDIEIIKNNSIFKDFKSEALVLISHLHRRYPNLPTIHFDFIASNILNAAATKYGDEYFIGINRGTYFLLLDMYSKMLANPSVLQNIGNCSLEAKEKKTLDVSMTNLGIEFCFNNDSSFIHPNDKTRYCYAMQFASFALNFLVFHESAHILRGHVGFKANKNKHPQFIWDEIEYHKFLNFSEEAAFSQTIEMDADSLATNWAFLMANSVIKNNNLANREQGPIFSSWDSFVFFWTFAIYSMFRLFGFNQFDISKAKEHSHPPPSIRTALICDNIVTLFLKKYGEHLASSITDISGLAAIEAEKAFTSVTYQENSHLNFISIYTDQDLTNYVFEITDNWNNVRPLLEPFSYGKLPPLKDITSK